MRKYISEDQYEQIIEMKLNRVPVRKIAVAVGCAVNTVTYHWREYLAEHSQERLAEVERTREELIQRQHRISIDARVGAMRAQREDDKVAETRFLAEERNALREIARLTGSDAPARIEHTGAPFTVLRIAEEPIQKESAQEDE